MMNIDFSKHSNKAVLVGDIDSVPELKSTSSGALLVFKLKTTETFRDRENQERVAMTWHRVVVWGKRGESLAPTLQRHQRVCVTGRIHNSSYDKDGVKRYVSEIVGFDVELAPRTSVPATTSQDAPRSNGGFVRPPAATGTVSLEDIPF